MQKGLVRSPLPWLSGLIVLYLGVPVIAFLIRFAGAKTRGFDNPGLFPAFFVSIETATISLAIITVLGLPLAYLLARSKSRLAGIVGLVVQLPLALPPLMCGILLIYLVGPYTFLGRLSGGHLTMSLAGIVLAQTFVAAPFLIVAARASFTMVDPGLADVAATLGHSEFSRFRRVAIPVASPGIRAGMLLAWLRAFGEYGAVVVLAYHPFTLPVYTYNQFSGVGLPTTLAPTALALGVAVTAVIVSRLRLRRGSPRPAVIPEPRSPEKTTPVPVRFDFDYRIGAFHLAVGFDLEAGRLAILGPSGAGKSALVRSLAGLHGSDPGPVSYGDQAVQRVRPEDRRVGYLAQGFSLFPHLSVWEQLLFPKGATREMASYWLEHLGLDGLENRYPSQLSGGQRQRVGLAQALCRSPRLLLLDEPFSALDTPVRRDLRREIGRLQRETGLTTVLVTHDPEDAAYLADEVIVLTAGSALQAGPTRQVFSRPASPAVARLLGIPNVHRAVVAAAGTLEAAGLRIRAHGVDMVPGTAVWWSVRPERVRLVADGDLAATVVEIADIGTATEVVVSLGPELELELRTTERPLMAVGDPCHLELADDAVAVWPVDAQVTRSS